ncbi:uncharacterized protein EDB93DRAFT_1106965 [Suillus bovinus]|uniref:uncharacterized protein n=1 Tax=Suillus bovinus TaxID=48563 RepID=UPI001B882665|nr:uncharacterized protein EDB93DRAFT_1106965 [Suillus bovinus]KAG2136095.1 hypothetical protein EDB93DRAFT_1106965 [Suillus bovinus]
MPNSPLESPTLQPVPALPTWEDCPDNTYEQDQGSFEPFQLPKTMASECRNHICITSWIEKLLQRIGDVLSATRMGSTNVKIVLGSHSIARDVAGVNIVAILSTGSVNGMVNSSSKVVLLMWDLFEGDEPEDQLEPEDLPSVSGPEFQPKENTMVIVDKSEVHRLETMFTFRVLDNFLLDNLECDTSAMNCYSKLWRMTSSMFPHLVPALGKDQYRELMRVARQWRQLKTMKWHGFGHCSNTPNAGDLALFCLTFSQPGINIPLSGDETLDEQMNMDYALCEAAQHNTEGITRAVTFYDINCQYNKHLQVRVDQSRFLKMVPELTIIPGIGLWHMHGHQDSCYVRYGSNFIEGIGQIDGEIMETLWAHLNLISPAARGMLSPHRQECLNFQMNDSNFCKMIHMKRTLCHKYKQAKN